MRRVGSTDSRLRKLFRLLKDGLTPRPPLEDPDRPRFIVRARVILLARLGLVGLGLVALFVPAWAELLGLNPPSTAAGCAIVAAYTTVALVLIESRWARPVVFGALCADLVFIVYLIVSSGGLRSPLIALQLIYTLFFTLAFPKPLGTLPPLLVLPIIARIDLLLTAASDRLAIFLLLLYAALNAAIVVAIVYLDERDRLADRELRRLEEARKELAVAEERSRLAREIHDGLGAALSGLVLQADYLRTRTEDSEVVRELGELRSSVQEGLDELRRCVSMLRADFELGPSLEDYVHNFAARHGLESTVEVHGSDPTPDPNLQLAVFRVVQEALTNVARHAQAKQVHVEVDFAPDTLRLRIRDDGRGFDVSEVEGSQPSADAPSDRHYGLTNMRERAQTLGARLDVRSAPGQGTTIELVVPRRR